MLPGGGDRAVIPQLRARRDIGPVTWLVGIIVGLALAGLGVRFMTSMPGRSYRSAFDALSAEERATHDELKRHVRVLAGEIGERNLWKPAALDAAAAYVTSELRCSGLDVQAQAYDVAGRSVKNLEAGRRGTVAPAEIVVVGAHYDSMAGCPAANDNASGVAAMLEIARLMRDVSCGRTIRYVAFVNEEPPFFFTANQGAVVYARRCRERRERIVAMYSLETIGCYLDGRGSQQYPFPFGLFYPDVGNFIAFVANLSSWRLVRRSVAAFRRHAAFPSEGVAAPGYLPGIYWSDQWAFWRRGYPAVMVTDTAPFRYPHYHTSADTPDKLDYERMARVVVGLANVVREIASSPV